MGETRRRPDPSEAPKSSDPRTTVEYADRSEETLRDHLLWQLELENLDARTTAIGQAIIDAINDDGYLTDDLETIRSTLAPDVLVSIEDVEQVLVKLVQQFDPVGIGARSVSECLQLQLAQLAPDTPGLELAKRIAAEHLPLVAEHQYGVLKRLLRVSDGEHRGGRSRSCARANRGPARTCSRRRPSTSSRTCSCAGTKASGWSSSTTRCRRSCA